MALRDANMLPCLYFLPGRRVVEEGAMSTAQHLFTTPEEQALIREEIAHLAGKSAGGGSQSATGSCSAWTCSHAAWAFITLA